jgi:hypothetical protein
MNGAHFISKNGIVSIVPKMLSTSNGHQSETSSISDLTEAIMPHQSNLGNFERKKTHGHLHQESESVSKIQIDYFLKLKLKLDSQELNRNLMEIEKKASRKNLHRLENDYINKKNNLK